MERRGCVRLSIMVVNVDKMSKYCTERRQRFLERFAVTAGTYARAGTCRIKSYIRVLFCCFVVKHTNAMSCIQTSWK